MAARASPPPAPAPATALRGSPPRSRGLIVAAFALLLAAQALSLARHTTEVLPDDALFYFFYVDNLAAGNGYRFNAEEPPVCGASAPLWPVVVAAVKSLGLSTLAAAQATSWAMTLAATLVLGASMLRLAGPLGVLALAPLLATWQLFSAWGVSGLESPMTYLIVASALLVASGGGGWILAGAVAGLCLVHKADLVPLGLALLWGCFLWRRREAGRALALAGGIALLWYAFAAWHFGSPLPNSLLTKIGVRYGDVPRSWFAHTAFLLGGGAVRTALALVGALALRRRPFLVAVALTQVLVPTLVFTLEVPSETFSWYVAAITPALALLAAGGLACLLRARAERTSLAHAGLALLVLGPLGAYLWQRESLRRLHWPEYLECYHGLMRQAGRWVDEHAPPTARVLTLWGNPGYYSRRFVYDATFLNRRRESADLFLHEPEVWINAQFGRLADFVPHAPYRVVHALETSRPCAPFYVAVLYRDPGAPPAPRPPARRDPPAVVSQLLEVARGDPGEPAFQSAAKWVEASLGSLAPERRRVLLRIALRRWPELAPLLGPAPPDD